MRTHENKTMLCLTITLLTLLAGISVSAQGITWERVLKTKFGVGAQIRAGASTTKKTALDPTVKGEAGAIPVWDKKAIVGSWLETVSFNGSPTPLKSLVTFLDDGNMLVADQGAVSDAVVFTAGHGLWTHLRERTFAWSQVEIIYDPATGGLMGYLKVSGVYTVGMTGNDYAGEFEASISAPDGTVLFTVDGTNNASRIPIQILP